MKVNSIGSNQTEITLSNGTIVLVSYSTPVACFIPGEGYYRTEQKWSVTTSKHINAWIKDVDSPVLLRPQSFFDELV